MTVSDKIVRDLYSINLLRDKYRMKNRITITPNDWEYYIMENASANNLRYIVKNTPSDELDSFLKHFVSPNKKEREAQAIVFSQPLIKMNTFESRHNPYRYDFLPYSVARCASGMILSLDKDRCMELFDNDEDKFLKYLYSIVNYQEYITRIISPWVFDLLKRHIDNPRDTHDMITSTRVLNYLRDAQRHAKIWPDKNFQKYLPSSASSTKKYSYPLDMRLSDALDYVYLRSRAGHIIDAKTLPEDIKLDFDKAQAIFDMQGRYYEDVKKEYFSEVLAAILDRKKSNGASNKTLANMTIEILRKIQYNTECVEYPEYIRSNKEIAEALIKENPRYFINLAEALRGNAKLFSLAAQNVGEDKDAAFMIYNRASEELKRSEIGRRLQKVAEPLLNGSQPDNKNKCVNCGKCASQRVRLRPELSEADKKALSTIEGLESVLKYQYSGGKVGHKLDFFDCHECAKWRNIHNCSIPLENTVVFEFIDQDELARMIKEKPSIVDVALSANKINAYLIPFECFSDVEVIKTCIRYGVNILHMLPLDILEDMATMKELLKGQEKFAQCYINVLEYCGACAENIVKASELLKQ